MKLNGSQAVLECLLAENVQTIFGYPGGANMPIYDALYSYGDRIRHILVRHEQGAVHAAEGYARVSGEPGVCLVTSGPGATNLVTGIADALMDSVPVVCITGQVAAHLLGSDAFQETDVIGITAPITKWNVQITDVNEIPEVFAKAFYIARNGRPGPVVIDITKSAQFDTLDFSYRKKKSIDKILNPPGVKKTQIRKASDFINKSKRPLLLVGHGVLISKAQSQLKEMMERCDIPAAVTLHGLSAVAPSHRLYAGMLGMHGNYAPNIQTNRADLIIALGMRFDDRVTGTIATYAKQAKIIHIDIDEAELNKNVPVDVAMHADVKQALTQLLFHLKKNKHTPWVNQFKELYSHEYEKVIRNETRPAQGKLTMAEVITNLSRETQGNSIVVSDVGQHQMVTARYYSYNTPGSYITSGGAGTMGFALPAALGASVAAPDRQVIAIIGDGSFQMTIQELGTVAQEQTPIKIVILNNNFLGMVRQWQQLFFDKRYSFTRLKNPDFVAITKGFGIEAHKVTKREELKDALHAMLSSRKPYLLEVDVATEHNVFPMIPSGASVDEVRLE